MPNDILDVFELYTNSRLSFERWINSVACVTTPTRQHRALLGTQHTTSQSSCWCSHHAYGKSCEWKIASASACYWRRRKTPTSLYTSHIYGIKRQ